MKSAHGFGHVFSSDMCLWGAANYFAVNASYSAKGYHHTQADGTKQVIFLEVSCPTMEEWYSVMGGQKCTFSPAIMSTSPLASDIEVVMEQMHPMMKP